MCGALTFVTIEHPMSFDIVKQQHKKGAWGKSTIEVVCVICGEKFETVSYGKNTRTTCSEACDTIRNIKYQQVRRSLEKQQKLDRMQGGMLQ